MRIGRDQLAYDLAATWEENCRRGPRLPPLEQPVPPTPLKQFLGKAVGSRFGISAGLLANSRWVLPYAERGYDLITYKTVRSIARPSYPVPNWVFVNDDGLGGPGSPVFVREDLDCEPRLLSSAVCFGMPSVPPDEWRADIRRTRELLPEGKFLAVSVVGTPSPEPTLEQLAEDFARTAAWAAEAGADAIEANLSCPNVCSAEGTLYQDVDASRQVVKEIRKAIGSKPLLLKVGVWAQEDRMRRFLQAVAGESDGLTLVNAVSRPVLHRDGRPAFGEKFRVAGVLGRAVFSASVSMMQDARRVVTEEGLPLTLVAVGGVSSVEDCEAFFQAGADAVLCGSSPMYLPDLAVEVKRRHPEW